MNLNQVNLIGRLGSDPEYRNLDNGNSVAKISLAITDKYKDKSGEWSESTTWLNCVFWGKLAENANQYLKKGLLIYLSGKISNRSYDDKDGQKKYITEVVANTFRLLEKRESGGEQQVASTTSNSSSNDFEDMPF